MTRIQNVSRFRLILESVTALVVFFILSVVVVTAFYFIVEGYNPETIQGISSLAGREKVKLYAFLTTPVAMLLTVFTILFMQKLRGQGLADLGLKKPDNIGRMVLYGIGIGVVVYGVAIAVQYVLAKFGYYPNFEDFTLIKGDLALYLFAMTGVAWLSAAFGEEILFRGFILNNLAYAFGGSKGAMICAVFVQALFFGLLHLNQSLAGAAAVTAMALVFGFGYMKFRNLWPLIIGHGLVDNLSFSLMYLGISN